MAWRLRVGFEVHARVRAQSKLFSGASASFAQDTDAKANAQVAFMDMGLPGTLPRLNGACVAQAVRVAAALKSTVQRRSVFERKHYFYGDSPLGYQITQQRWPVALGGALQVKVPGKDGVRTTSVRITRVQIEQDTGRSLDGGANTLIDLNRAGAGVLEIVTEPDVESVEEAGAFCAQMRALLTAIDVCDGDMHKGSLRFDVNVSAHRPGVDSHRVEVKNVNGVKFVQRAVELEFKRLQELYDSHEGPAMQHETRGFDALRGVTEPLRDKDGAKDYRFLPEPDLLPLEVPDSLVEHLTATLPPLPDEILADLLKLGLRELEALTLLNEPGGVAYLKQAALSASGAVAEAQVASWITNVLLGRVRRQGKQLADVLPAEYAGELVRLEHEGVISQLTAKNLLDRYLADSSPEEGESLMLARTPSELVEAEGLQQTSDTDELEAACQAVLAEAQASKKGRKALKAYFGGKEGLVDLFVGQAMRKTQGRANPTLLRARVVAALDAVRAESTA